MTGRNCIRSSHHPSRLVAAFFTFFTLTVGGGSPFPPARADPAAPATPTTRPTADPAGGPLRAEYRQYTWRRDQPPVKMISKDEGFCFLSEVGGHFAGGGEAASVYIGDDGYWYLGGHAAQELFAKAYSVKFSAKVVASVLPPADPAERAWREALADFAKSDDAAVRDVAVRELTATHSGAAELMGLADAWDKATKAQLPQRRRLAEAHVLRLYEAAVGELSGEPADAARQKLRAVRIALANRRLNDMGVWQVRKGQWSATPDGGIEGDGDSELAFPDELPADCYIEFRVVPVQGMRTRILFLGTDLEVGNEGLTHQIEVHGAETQHGVPLPYINGDELKLGVRFAGKEFEFYVNGELRSKGTRKTVPQRMGVVLRSGDDFDPGTARFRDFKVSDDRQDTQPSEPKRP